ncbi:ABC transporter permease [Roseomonas hellenica]|uniref:ABC transporter permease n=1 Tax=Plastoroseomonas hellenica TaxID=2687306 RepID=A0ABS5ES89_9PROT|nr:ABC transporter permease [Plastoroseomonas hellenica]MBR0662775.1 ABC transporter permease [Plastoroseomonas hellenica]
MDPIPAASAIADAALPAHAAAPMPQRRLWRRMLGNPGLVVAALVLGLIAIMAVAAPLVAPHDPYEQSLDTRMTPPAFVDAERSDPAHLLGTDNLGRDYLSRLIYGARISLLIGFFTMLVSGVIGTVLGIAAGYFGGRTDMVVSFLVTTRLSLPVVMVALAVVAVLGGSLQVVVLVLGLLLWDRFAVVMRSATMQVRGREYITAARAIGCSVPRILWGEVLPNVLSGLVVIASYEMAQAILLEAALSFLGLGVQPPLPSWGLMVSEAKEFMLFEPWMIMLPGAAICLLVLAINLLGDGIRDITAPEGRS